VLKGETLAACTPYLYTSTSVIRRETLTEDRSLLLTSTGLRNRRDEKERAEEKKRERIGSTNRTVAQIKTRQKRPRLRLRGRQGIRLRHLSRRRASPAPLDQQPPWQTTPSA